MTPLAQMRYVLLAIVLRLNISKHSKPSRIVTIQLEFR